MNNSLRIIPAKPASVSQSTLFMAARICLRATPPND
jgi:hypothetical protein